MTRLWIVTVTLLSATMLFAADGADLNSPQGRDAMARHDKQVAAAQAAYKQALLKAKGDCVRDLKVALTVATRQLKLDDANQLKAQIDRLEGEIAKLASKERSEEFAIAANLMWNNTVRLAKGQRVRIQTAGQWSPNGRKELGDVSKWPPRGRIGEGGAFQIGTDLTYTADADGMLQIGIHDGERQDFYNDNVGTIRATITFLPDDAPAK